MRQSSERRSGTAPLFIHAPKPDVNS